VIDAVTPKIDLWKEEILRARKMTVADKLALGGDLFDAACEVAISGIRAQHGDLPPQALLKLLRKRLALARRLESRL